MPGYKLIVKNAKVILKTVTNAVLNISGIKDLLTGTGSVDSNNKINWTLQEYTNTAANFTSNNPVLLLGQKGIETDDLLTTPKFKIGDGVTAWNSLPYANSGGSGLSGLTTNKVLKATSSTTAGDSSIIDDGTTVAINKTPQNYAKLEVNGGASLQGAYITTQGQIGLNVVETSGIANKSEVSTGTTFRGNITNTNGVGLDIEYTPTSTNLIKVYGNGNMDLLGTIKNSALTASKLLGSDASKNIVSLDTSTYPSLTELAYVKGLTSAVQPQLDNKLPIEATQTTGVSLTFLTDSVYGTIGTPETGNITYSATGAVLGVTNIIIHNHSSAPTFAANMKKLSGSSDYVTSVVNYIYITYINSTEVIYSINQRT